MDFVAVSIKWVGKLEGKISKTLSISVYRTNPGIPIFLFSLEKDSG